MNMDKNDVNMNVTAIIPARSGSKSIRDKNIRIFNGKPLLAYSIEAALASKSVTHVVVSTDSQKYAQIAREYGAEVPFLRPVKISQDHSLDIDVFLHYLSWSKANLDMYPEILVHLRPTHPIRKSEDIDNMVKMLIDDATADSVRSVFPAQQTPYKMWLFDDNCYIKPVAICDIDEAYNSPRQVLPKVYMQNACIDVTRSRTVLQMNSMTGENILGYCMTYNFDIDTEEEFLNAERVYMIQSKVSQGKKLKICFDIDGVIAAKTLGNEYTTATPISENVRLLQRLYKSGHTIVLHTARGYATGLDWKEVTEAQMKAWNVPYDALTFGKPDADIYVDDKLIELDKLQLLL